MSKVLLLLIIFQLRATHFSQCLVLAPIIAHMRRKVKNIGRPRFRILGGGGGGAKGEPNSQQAHDVVLTSMRRNDVMCLLGF